MGPKEFDELCDRVRRGVASARESEAFVNHARTLYSAVIDAISDTDTWDQDWPEIGYKRWVDEGVPFEDYLEWQERLYGKS